MQRANLTAQGGARPPCIVDVRLALSRYGQLSIARLVREFDVWIPHELNRVLRDTRSHLVHASQLTPRPYSASLRGINLSAETEIVKEELAQWDRRPEEDELALLPLYYIGERADECVIPADVD